MSASSSWVAVFRPDILFRGLTGDPGGERVSVSAVFCFFVLREVPRPWETGKDGGGVVRDSVEVRWLARRAE